MIIRVRVLPNSRSEAVLKTGEGRYKVKVREKALDGKANAAVVDALAGYFGVRRSGVRVVKGVASRDKVVEVLV